MSGWLSDRVARILVEEYEAGASVQQLADSSGYSITRVRALLAKGGAEFRGRGRPREDAGSSERLAFFSFFLEVVARRLVKVSDGRSGEQALCEPFNMPANSVVVRDSLVSASRSAGGS